MKKVKRLITREEDNLSCEKRFEHYKEFVSELTSGYREDIDNLIILLRRCKRLLNKLDKNIPATYLNKYRNSLKQDIRLILSNYNLHKVLITKIPDKKDLQY